MKPGQKFRVGTNLARLRGNGIPGNWAGTIRVFERWCGDPSDGKIMDTTGWKHIKGNWQPYEEQLEFAFMDKTNV